MEPANAVRPLLEQSIEIAAPVAEVWALVSDVRRMPEWSPQVTSTRLRSGFETCELGAQFTNRNAYGELEWTTHAEIVRFEPERELAFRVEENWAIWSFHLSTSGDGTLLTQRRELPDGLSDLSRELTDGFMGGQDAFTRVSLRDARDAGAHQGDSRADRRGAPMTTTSDTDTKPTGIGPTLVGYVTDIAGHALHLVARLIGR